MTTFAPGGALHEGPPRPRALLPALGPLGPVVRPVRPVLAPVLRAALPAHLRHRPFLPPKPRIPPHVPPPARDHTPAARSLTVPVACPLPPVAPELLAPGDAPIPSDIASGVPLAVPSGVPLAVPADDRAGVPADDTTQATTAEVAVETLVATGRRRVLIAVAALGAVTAAAVAVLLSPLGAVRGVELQGAGPRWQPAVRAALAPELGRTALLVDVAAVAARVEAVPGVRSASVSVRWPGTLVVDIDERSAAAAVPVDGGVRLIDASGADLGVVATAPQGVLRVVAADASGVGVRAVEGVGVAAAVTVRAQLPAALAAQVTEVGATTVDGVWFRLRDGATVVWGSAGRGADKADVLAALRSATPGAARYDVSTPDAPAVTPR